MRIIRGTTPTIIINVKDDTDLSLVEEVWVYISQQKKVRIDKTIESIEIIPEEKKILVLLTQQDTLNLKEGDALFQIRLLLTDGTALATVARDIEICQVYKGGVIENV